MEGTILRYREEFGDDLLMTMKKNVLILTYWSYPDALIQTYTLPYVRIIVKKLPAGSTVSLLTLEKDPQTLNRLSREKIQADLAAVGISWLPFPYRPFGLTAFFMWMGIGMRLCFTILTKRISILHCWCTPAGAVGYVLARLLRRKLVIDSYEPHAEAMVENGTWKADGLAFRLLFWLEKKQTRYAHFIISATAGMRDYALAKYQTKIIKFAVKPACVDFDMFTPAQPNESLRRQLKLHGKIVCVYAGKFGGIYLADEVFQFAKRAADYWGDVFRFLILTNHTQAEISSYCLRADLPVEAVVSTFVSHQEVPLYLSLANFALTPVKPVPSKRYCTPIKDGEYWAMGLPVVIPAGVSDDADIIAANDIGAVLTQFSAADYDAAIGKIDRLLLDPAARKRTMDVARKYRCFEIAENAYTALYQHEI